MYTYFVSNNVTSYIKIGRTKNILQRIQSLSNQIAFVKLNVEYYIEGDYEKFLHRYYSEFRKEGEWFDILLPDKDYITSLVGSTTKKTNITTSFGNMSLFTANPFISSKLSLEDLLLLSGTAVKIYLILYNRHKNTRSTLNEVEYLRLSSLSMNSKRLYYAGIVELYDKGLIAPTDNTPRCYWININVMFNGDRTKLSYPEEH